MFPRANCVSVPPMDQLTEDACLGSEFERKLVPVKVSINGAAAPPTTAFGLLLVNVGGGFGGGLMMKLIGLERPFCPVPEAGFLVSTVAMPGLATRAALTVAVTVNTFPFASRVTVVGMMAPFHRTLVCGTKPMPVTNSVKPALPALIWLGERKVTAAPVLL